MTNAAMHYAALREEMVVRQIAARGVHDRRVLEAMRNVPRERFVQPALASRAYADAPLAIGHGQTISQPYIVALMIDALGLVGSETVLEVGTGSGYGAAVLGRLARDVYSIERHAPLAHEAAERLATLGFLNVHVRQGDGTLGLVEQAPFDAIVVAAGGPRLPPALLDQLALGGRLLVPVGRSLDRQHLVRIIRRSALEYTEDDLGPVAFVPLVGAEGWAENAE
jgi:protein-L-isoaspartate(D-aspartate) O-methyltransferase